MKVSTEHHIAGWTIGVTGEQLCNAQTSIYIPSQPSPVIREGAGWFSVLSVRAEKHKLDDIQPPQAVPGQTQNLYTISREFSPAAF